MNNNFLTIPTEKLKIKRRQFFDSIKSKIAGPTDNNQYLFEIENTFYNDKIFRGMFLNNTVYGAVDLETMQIEISSKVDEWILAWNVNNQIEAFSNMFGQLHENKFEILKNILKEKIIESKDGLEILIQNNDAITESVTEPKLKALPDKPKYKFEEETDFIDLLFFKKKLKQQYDESYSNLIKEWEIECRQIEKTNQNIVDKHKSIIEENKRIQEEYDNKRIKLVDEIELLKSYQINIEKTTIKDTISIILQYQYLPPPFLNSFEFEFDEVSKSLVIDLILASPDDMPKYKSANYVEYKSKPKELKLINLKEKELNEIYNKSIYSIQLLTAYNIFKSDQNNEIEIIIINGWVDHLDKSIGQKVNKCITSISINKRDMMAINLQLIEPSLCFRNLKGISAPKLLDILPIPPISTTKKIDKRFVDNKNVIDRITPDINLSEMDWEDFEHLVRELFEKEFSINGGEVKITQASRDGGVDAIAFDPDPIRGGKIVIQAKRYNNIVGVSAVRDLYGTTLNEGANKGILVTTSNYGSDAYEFAKGKPITLLNGSNLLYLLEKHGYNAQINLSKKIKF
jgi:restriction system protein